MSNEIMTGYYDFLKAPQTMLSDTTLGALADIGYSVQDPSAGTFVLINSGLSLA